WDRRRSRLSGAAVSPLADSSPPSSVSAALAVRSARIGQARISAQAFMLLPAPAERLQLLSESAPPAARGTQRNGRLFCQDQEGEALLDVEPHALGIVPEIADREILPDGQLEVAAAQGDRQAAFDPGRPNDLAVDQALHVAQHGVAAFRTGREIPVELVVQH